MNKLSRQLNDEKEKASELLAFFVFTSFLVIVRFICSIQLQALFQEVRS